MVQTYLFGMTRGIVVLLLILSAKEYDFIRNGSWCFPN